VLEQLYSIINTRYEDERAMIVTTNLRYEELIAQLGERTVSRLVAICGDGLPLYGEDDRLSHRDRRENLSNELAELSSAPSA
jgi:DNA replication protein DnaC